MYIQLDSLPLIRRCWGFGVIENVVFKVVQSILLYTKHYNYMKELDCIIFGRRGGWKSSN